MISLLLKISFENPIYNYTDDTLIVTGNGTIDKNDVSNKVIFYSFKNLYIYEQITGIGAYSFNFYHGISKVIIDSPLVFINEHAFGSCNFSILELPNTVTSIGDHAFYQCLQLKTIRFKNPELGNIENISESTFSECLSLIEVDLGKNIKRIEKYAFGESGLTSFIVLESIEKLDLLAFYECSNLKGPRKNKKWEFFKSDVINTFIYLMRIM